jgi:cell division protein ZapA
MKQIEVQIMGQSYLLGTPEGGESQLLDAVERVDTAMCKIRDAGKVRARERIAVLAALNLAFELSDHGGAGNSGPASSSAAMAIPLAGRAQPASSATPSTKSDPLLVSLLERLDSALGDDGRLI